MTVEFTRDVWPHNWTFTGKLNLKFTTLFSSLCIISLLCMLNAVRSARSFSSLSHVHHYNVRTTEITLWSDAKLSDRQINDTVMNLASEKLPQRTTRQTIFAGVAIFSLCRTRRQQISSDKYVQGKKCRQADQIHRPYEPNKQNFQMQPDNCWRWQHVCRRVCTIPNSMDRRNILAGYVECLTKKTAVQHQFDVFLLKVSFIEAVPLAILGSFSVLSVSFIQTTIWARVMFKKFTSYLIGWPCVLMKVRRSRDPIVCKKQRSYWFCNNYFIKTIKQVSLTMLGC